MPTTRTTQHHKPNARYEQPGGGRGVVGIRRAFTLLPAASTPDFESLTRGGDSYPGSTQERILLEGENGFSRNTTSAAATCSGASSRTRPCWYNDFPYSTPPIPCHETRTYSVLRVPQPGTWVPASRARGTVRARPTRQPGRVRGRRSAAFDELPDPGPGFRGSPIPAGTKEVFFRVYGVESGAGAVLWSEQTVAVRTATSRSSLVRGRGSQ